MAKGKVKPAVVSEPAEGPWALPNGWRWERLGQLLPLSYGKALRAADRSTFGQIPVYGSAGIAGLHDSALCHEPSIIVGRKGSAGSVYHADGPSFTIDTAYYCSRLAANINLRLAYHLLTYLNLRKLDQSTAVPSLGRDTYNDIIVPVPPEEAQAPLAARIDELFTEIDDGEAALERARGDLATWRKALLKAAVTGELTADWRTANPPTETGADLLARILTERRTRWLADPRNRGKRYAETSGVDEDALSKLPHGWAWASLQQVSERITDGTHQPPSFVSSGVPFIVIQTIYDDGIDWTKVKRFVSYETFIKETARLRPSRGDVLYTAVGSYGIAIEVRDDRDFMFQRHIAHVRPLAFAISSAFLSSALNSPLCFHQADTKAKGVAQKTVTLGDLSAFHIPLPPCAEQREIEHRLRKMNSGERSVNVGLGELESASATLRQSILAAAFRGDLVA